MSPSIKLYCRRQLVVFIIAFHVSSVEPTAVAKLPSGEIVMAAVSDVIESSKRARRSDDDDSVVVGAAAAVDDRETLDLDLDLDDKQNRPPRFPFLNALFSGIISNIVNNRPNGLFANLFGLRSTVSVTQTQVISVRILQVYFTLPVISFIVV